MVDQKLVTDKIANDLYKKLIDRKIPKIGIEEVREAIRNEFGDSAPPLGSLSAEHMEKAILRNIIERVR